MDHKTGRRFIGDQRSTGFTTVVIFLSIPMPRPPDFLMTSRQVVLADDENAIPMSPATGDEIDLEF
jgi:hypothetical protein